MNLSRTILLPYKAFRVATPERAAIERRPFSGGDIRPSGGTGSWLAARSPNRSTRQKLRLSTKRTLDLVLATLGLMALSPVFLLLMLAVRLDGGPAFFAHRRIGRGGHGFGCLKFRSMATNADAILAAHLNANPAARAEWEATRKLRDDPRVTRVGRILRSTSLDELPQLVNVLRGEMSLVGPRPVVQRELDLFYGAAGASYAKVRPGITGLWQVSGRSDASYDSRVALDVAYVETLSLRRDLMILVRTVLVVLSRKGAY